jgi:hypothetical protein
MSEIKGIFGITTERNGDADACPNCGMSHHAPQKALVAFSDHLKGEAAILEATAALACDLHEGGLHADDVWDTDEGGGLMIWEGVIQYCGDHYEGYDVDYVGKFRPLNDDEWDLLRAGKDVL